MNPQERKNLGRVLIKALWAGGAELLDIPTIKAGIAVVEVIRKEWFLAEGQPQLNAEAIAELTPQETQAALKEAQQELGSNLPSERQAELEVALLNLPRTFQAGSRALSSLADFTRVVPLRPLLFDPGQVTADGQYRLKQFLGAGSFGEVWRAEHLDKRVEHAVKFCTDPLAAQILQRERDVLRELLGQLQTAQIVSLEQSNFAIDPPYLAFTFCPGGDLVDWISRRREKEGRVPVAKALLIIQQVAQGLAAAHKLGIVHRDMKPGNILLDAQGQAVITDFGLGRIGVENNLALFSQMAAGVSSVGLGVAGTPLYMPPEIRQGRIPRDDLAGLKKGDVYALGVTAFQLFLGDVEAEPINVRRQLNRQQVPESVIDLIEDCISPSNERPPDAVALAFRLQPVVRPVNPPNLSASATVANLAKAAKARQNTPPTPTASTQADIVAQLARIAQSSRGELPESPAPRQEAEPDSAIDPSQRAWSKLNNIGRDLWQKIKNELL